MSTETTNMNLSVPETGDSNYPELISTSMDLIDQHDHSSGKGVELGTDSVPSAAIKSGAVTSDKLGSGSVTGAKLNASAADGSTLEVASGSMRLKDSGVDTSKVADGAITQAKRAALPYALSSSCGAVTVVSDANITNLSVTLTTTGRPVRLELVSDGGPTGAGFYGQYASAANALMYDVLFKRDGSTVAQLGYAVSDYTSGLITAIATPSMFGHTDIPAAGSHTYTVAVHIISADTVNANRIKLLAYER